jgi:phosphoglucosamine mutase
MSMLTENGWTLGGESSGHIICLDKCTTGDGIVAALQVLQAMVDQRLSLHQIKQGMRIYPQTLINVRLTGSELMRAGALDECESIRKALHKARSELGSAGRVLLRPSGTEPVIRVMVEGEDEQRVSQIGRDLAEEVRSAAI